MHRLQSLQLPGPLFDRMDEIVLLLLVWFILAVLGCVLLSLGQAKHWQAVHGKSGKKIELRRSRQIAWVCLSVSLVGCIISEGVSFATLLYPLLFAVGAGITALSLSYRPALLHAISIFVSRVSKPDR